MYMVYGLVHHNGQYGQPMVPQRVIRTHRIWPPARAPVLSSHTINIRIYLRNPTEFLRDFSYTRFTRGHEHSNTVIHSPYTHKKAQQACKMSTPCTRTYSDFTPKTRKIFARSSKDAHPRQADAKANTPITNSHCRIAYDHLFRHDFTELRQTRPHALRES